MAPLKLVVKPTAGGANVEVEVEPSVTVLELKEEVGKKNGMPAAEQRLIYKGQILKDERTVESYGGLDRGKGRAWVSRVCSGQGRRTRASCHARGFRPGAASCGSGTREGEERGL